jgi:RNA polymerase sigma factor (sigma-70 family)
LLWRLATSTDSDEVLHVRWRQEGKGGRDIVAEVLIGRYANIVWATCLKCSRSPADACDAFQATFLALHENLDRLRAEHKGWLPKWLTTVAKNACSRIVKQQAKFALLVRGLLSAEVIRTMSGPDHGVDDRDMCEWLREAIERLPAALREPVELVTLGGVSPTDAAKRLKVSARTVRNRLDKAFEVLRGGMTKPLAAAAGVAGGATPGAAAPPWLIRKAVQYVLMATEEASCDAIPPMLVELARAAASGARTALAAAVTAGTVLTLVLACTLIRAPRSMSAPEHPPWPAAGQGQQVETTAAAVDKEEEPPHKVARFFRWHVEREMEEISWERTVTTGTHREFFHLPATGTKVEHTWRSRVRVRTSFEAPGQNLIAQIPRMARGRDQTSFTLRISAPMSGVITPEPLDDVGDKSPGESSVPCRYTLRVTAECKATAVAREGAMIDPVEITDWRATIDDLNTGAIPNRYGDAVRECLRQEADRHRDIVSRQINEVVKCSHIAEEVFWPSPRKVDTKLTVGLVVRPFKICRG